jgi:cytochrome c biogenesis protein CcdA
VADLLTPHLLYRPVRQAGAIRQDGDVARGRPSDAPLALAVAAGMLAAVNPPCGFALLPAYLSVLVAGGGGRGAAVARAVGATGAMTAGFVAVFGLFGLVVTPVAGSVQRHLPWITIGVGLLLVALGGWLLAGRQLPGLTMPGQSRGPVVRRSLPSMAVFGAAYAVASLSCTIGPFLVIVATSFRAGSTITGIGLFLAYAAGMGLTVAVAAVAVALARDGLLRLSGRVRLTPACRTSS